VIGRQVCQEGRRERERERERREWRRGYVGVPSPAEAWYK
jgi:hypothetical protein